MFALLWLGVILASLWLLAALLSWHIQGLILLVTNNSRLAVAAYDLVVLPGVVLHELSHVVAALVLRVPIMRVSLFQFRRYNDLRQGEVVLGHADPLRMSLIGVAPLVVGMGALVLLLHTFVPASTLADHSLIGQLRSLLSSPRAALGLYLLVAVANTMFPSAADCQSWRVAGGALLPIGSGLLLLSMQPALPLQQTLVMLIAQLMSSLRSVVIIDMVCLGAILLLEIFVGRMRKRRVVYRSIRP
jgi:hypothetical protein